MNKLFSLFTHFMHPVRPRMDTMFPLRLTYMNNYITSFGMTFESNFIFPVRPTLPTLFKIPSLPDISYPVALSNILYISLISLVYYLSPLPEFKFPEGRAVCLFWLVLYSQCLEQFLTHGEERISGNTCWVNEWKEALFKTFTEYLSNTYTDSGACSHILMMPATGTLSKKVPHLLRVFLFCFIHKQRSCKELVCKMSLQAMGSLHQNAFKPKIDLLSYHG